ncbi:hypothetical protein KA119_00035 [Candidatus Gracilibacteria bacterium]|nr:hypothetical protein [Candidatus Gracilibacteria bacterium]
MLSSSSTPVIKTLTEIDEIVQNLLLLLSEKEKEVITKRFNLDQEGKRTLEEIGQEFAVTRERVRQIEKNALNKMKRNVFNTALSGLNEFVTGIVRSNGGLIRKKNLLTEIKSLLPENQNFEEGPLDLSFALHDEIESVGNTINFHPHLREKAIPEYNLKFAANNLINQLQKYGDAKNLTKIHSDLSPVLGEIDFNIVKVKSLIEIDKRLKLLSDNNVGLSEWRHIHPRTLRDKILFILKSEKKPLHFNDIADKISASKFDNRNINVQAVHNELIRHQNFVLIGRGIYALSEWGYEKGTVADVIEAILREHKELSQEEITAKVLEKRQVKKITITLALKNNPNFVRTGRKVYTLKKDGGSAGKDFFSASRSAITKSTAAARLSPYNFLFASDSPRFA